MTEIILISVWEKSRGKKFHPHLNPMDGKGKARHQGLVRKKPGTDKCQWIVGKKKKKKKGEE